MTEQERLNSVSETTETTGVPDDEPAERSSSIMLSYLLVAFSVSVGSSSCPGNTTQV